MDEARSYDADSSFDLKVGMAVFGAKGEKIGTVTDVSGFGSAPARESSAAPRVETKASEGTGHFEIDRAESVGLSLGSLTLSFSAIGTVDAVKGVTLTDAAIAGLSNEPTKAPPIAVDTVKRKTHFWQRGR
jgi:hypothetical protein